MAEPGTDRFVLRTMRPEDHCAYADFVARIDASDLRRRFFHSGDHAPEIDFERQTQIEEDLEVAFVAVSRSRQGAEEIVGEARLYRYRGSRTAEIAIIVRSDVQRRGLGHALMQKTIEYCAAHGLEMIARILPENVAMICLAERSGMHVEHRGDSDVAIAHMHAGDGRSPGADVHQ